MTAVEIDGRSLALSNLEKVLWPDAGFTKGAMVDYYVRVAGALLPHLAGRAMSLRRFPDGVEGVSWYQDECRGAPGWLATEELRGYRYCVVNDLASLVWVANLAAIELHPFLALAAEPDRPTALVLDLDPGPPADVLDCCRVALRIRDLLAELGLASLPKATGSVGLHVHVPLAAGHGFPETKAFARALAGALAAELPDRVVAAQRRSLRPGKVLVDWLQNDPTRSTVAPYSLRGTAWPTVAAPVAWEEVERAVAEGRAELLTFLPQAVLERLEGHGDLFGPALELEQALPSL